MENVLDNQMSVETVLRWVKNDTTAPVGAITPEQLRRFIIYSDSITVCALELPDGSLRFQHTKHLVMLNALNFDISELNICDCNLLMASKINVIKSFSQEELDQIITFLGV